MISDVLKEKDTNNNNNNRGSNRIGVMQIIHKRHAVL